jgi:hypothetical protein
VSLVYVPLHPGSHANGAGLYELVATSNPRSGEEAGADAVLDTDTERRRGLDTTNDPPVRGTSRVGEPPKRMAGANLAASAVFLVAPWV